jgi:uncharacterized HAD superfamily protein
MVDKEAKYNRYIVDKEAKYNRYIVEKEEKVTFIKTHSCDLSPSCLEKWLLN